MNAEKKANQRRLIQKLKAAIKKEKSFLDKCKEYGKNPSIINSVHISFQPLDVSAKTVDGKIYLNEKLFEDDNWHDQMRYAIHEAVHVLQQETGSVKEKEKNKEYLDNEHEQEAFKAQIVYMNDHVPERELQEYLEQLLDHHDIKGKERKRKIEILTEDI